MLIDVCNNFTILKSFDEIEDEDCNGAFHNMGILYFDQGKLIEAEKMYQRALDGKEKAWGPDHTSTLNTVNNLGLLYADQGKLAEAEKIYQQTLTGFTNLEGPDHPKTKLVNRNLSIVRGTWGLGKYLRLLKNLVKHSLKDVVSWKIFHLQESSKTPTQETIFMSI